MMKTMTSKVRPDGARVQEGSRLAKDSAVHAPMSPDLGQNGDFVDQGSPIEVKHGQGVASQQALTPPRRDSGVHAGAASLAKRERPTVDVFTQSLKTFKAELRKVLSKAEQETLTRDFLEDARMHLGHFGVRAKMLQREHEPPCLQIIGQKDSLAPLSRFASGLARNLHGVELIYDPHALAKKGFTAMYEPKKSQIVMSEQAMISAAPGDAEIHEARHAFHQKKSKGSELFLGKVIPSGRVKTSGHLGPYTFLLSVDEMSAYAITTALTASGLGKIKKDLLSTQELTREQSSALQVMGYRLQGWARANRPLLETIRGECDHWQQSIEKPKRKAIKVEQIGTSMSRVTWRSGAFWKGSLMADFRTDPSGQGGIVALQEPSYGGLLAFELRDVDFDALVKGADAAGHFEHLDGAVKENLSALKHIADTQLAIYAEIEKKCAALNNLVDDDIEGYTAVVEALHRQIRALKSSVTNN
jgi:hypothetical protein